jgi:hypothetical protein
MNFELFDTAFKHGEGLSLNSKFKIENSKFSRPRQVTQTSEAHQVDRAKISSEEN